ncbi:glycine betaine ABC transporter substrate-binding protein [Asticcacaulis sp. EMRT-3]|uniref:glycine betaine ABC transporter substrate-binding protein n=1 Tax=Asticcacaulis sp. EMRT-3 TaxID=3040349 RepID=UPI0024AF397B|nr:glycine betaine ABC transporter substrate-binding protein [Asticcacaulis sp. EMRT-3]MDI7775025.1 glycine betaine ABC transporter substrate-binding protein [Asticcacaulis sp. EMRT-3]
MTRRYLSLVLTCLALSWLMVAPARAADPAAPACGGVVSFAGLNWESGEFLTAVMRQILERGYGCRTNSVPGNTVTLEQALADDDIQIIAEEWVSRSDTWKQAADAGKVRAIGHPFSGASEGWYVPDYMVHGPGATARDLRDVSQLAEPAYVRLFADPEQPSRGRFLNCPSGWTCEGVNTAKLHAYGLDHAYVDFRPGTGPAMDAAIVSAYAQKQPLLFYYWSPSAIAGKLKLFRLHEPAWSAACWQDLISKNGRHIRGCEAPPADIAYGVSAAFAGRAPQVVAVLQKANVPIDVLNASLVAIADRHADPAAQAVDFLKTRPDLWRGWVDRAAALRIEASLEAAPVAAKSNFPAGWTISIRQPVNRALAALVAQHGGAFRAVSGVLLAGVVALDRLLAATPWWLLIAGFVALAWLGARRLWLCITVGGLMLVTGLLGLWDAMTQTLSLMLIASGIAFILGVPAGIITAKSRSVRLIVMPVLDVMQTMPGFVYLIPALMLFGLGKVPAILATLIYCLPPMVRLTALGIERVDPELREAGEAFGLTPLQMLWRVELPLAAPTMMAGVNQMIMLALSMVVVASMIGARGLGEQVLNGIQTLDVGQGLEAGIGIVILAFVLDRITQGFGRKAAA